MFIHTFTDLKTSLEHKIYFSEVTLNDTCYILIVKYIEFITISMLAGCQ